MLWLWFCSSHTTSVLYWHLGHPEKSFAGSTFLPCIVWTGAHCNTCFPSEDSAKSRLSSQIKPLCTGACLLDSSNWFREYSFHSNLLQWNETYNLYTLQQIVYSRHKSLWIVTHFKVTQSRHYKTQQNKNMLSIYLINIWQIPWPIQSIICTNLQHLSTFVTNLTAEQVVRKHGIHPGAGRSASGLPVRAVCIPAVSDGSQSWSPMETLRPSVYISLLFFGMASVTEPGYLHQVCSRIYMFQKERFDVVFSSFI